MPFTAPSGIEILLTNSKEAVGKGLSPRWSQLFSGDLSIFCAKTSPRGSPIAMDFEVTTCSPACGSKRRTLLAPSDENSKLPLEPRYQRAPMATGSVSAGRGTISRKTSSHGARSKAMIDAPVTFSMIPFR